MTAWNNLIGTFGYDEKEKVALVQSEALSHLLFNFNDCLTFYCC